MTKTVAEKVKEFTDSFANMEGLQSVVSAFNSKDDATSRASARNSLISKIPFSTENQRTWAYAHADDHEVGEYAGALKLTAEEDLETKFEAGRKNIIEAIPANKLESLALSIPPVELPNSNSRAERHNGAIPLWQSHNEIFGMNLGYDQAKQHGAGDSSEYRKFISGTVAQDISVALKVKKGDSDKIKQAQQLYASATARLALQSEEFARATGVAIQDQRAKNFKNYFKAGNKKELEYGVSDFARSNLMYGESSQVIPIAGQLLKKKK